MWKVACWVTVCMVWGNASAQPRVKGGCFEQYEMSCNTMPDEVDTSVNPEEICTRLSVEVFESQWELLNTASHAKSLNRVDANTEFCRQIQQAYHQCVFCLEEEAYSSCYNEADFGRCDGKPTQEELLSSNEYPLFQTIDDIQQACSQLEIANNYSLNTFLKDDYVGMPPTIELCTKQSQAKHLCDYVYCDGGCFDGPNGNPPTCETNSRATNESEAYLQGEVCAGLGYIFSMWLPLEDILNISKHQEYLRWIPGNSTMCDEAQLAYSECDWCAAGDEDRCFNEENPPSCDTPDSIDDTIDFYSTCDILSIALETDLVYGSQDFYNLSLHTDSFLFKANNTFCDNARQAYHKCEWCNATDLFIDCPWCESNATVPDDYVFPPLWSKLNISDPEGLGNCSQVLDFWANVSYPSNIEECYRDIWVRRQCSVEFDELWCSSYDDDIPERENIDYLGAETISQARALVWMSRIAAFLSFGGACYVIWSIFSNVKRQKSVYYHLLFGMAIFDVITAAAWVFATAPLPEKDADHVYGASGTEATCKAQAFFVQLGFTSIFYNVSLAFYYVMVVAYGRKEFQLKAIQHYLHGFPLLIGFGLAFGAIPRYHWIEYGCHILPHSPNYKEGELWAVLVFVVLPLGFSIASISAAMLVVYWKVSRQTAKAKKWQLGKGGINQLESQVFWQCLFYALAFYVTWPILFSVYIASVDVGGPLGLTLTVSFVAPLQGFNNFIVFVRPKVLRLARNRWPRLERTQDPSGGTKSSHTDRGGTTTSSNKAQDSHHESTTRQSEVEGSLPEPVIDGLEEISTRESCVVHFPDGTSQALEDVDDMDPSALLPLTTKDSIREADDPHPPRTDYYVPKFESIQEEVAVDLPARSPPSKFHIREESLA